jgi:hypothetical protein
VRRLYGNAPIAASANSCADAFGTEQTTRWPPDTLASGPHLKRACPNQSLKGMDMTSITRRLATLAGIVFVAMALGCASTTKKEGTGEYVDDTVITTKVKAAIFNEPTLKSAEINVETFKGVVQLSGFVSSAANETLAVQVARNVAGVKSVKDDMRLK